MLLPIVVAANTVAAACNIILIVLLYKWYGPSRKVGKDADNGSHNSSDSGYR